MKYLKFSAFFGFMSMLLVLAMPLKVSAQMSHWVDSAGDIVRNSAGECWRNSGFNIADQGLCDGDAPAPAAEPVAAGPADADRDGVLDANDRCPNTANGVAVDGNGCALDSDGDGVPDYLDQCPGTAAGASVDTRGCINKITLLGEVLFDTNSSEIRPEARAILDDAYSKLQNSSSQLRIIGHADSRGSDDFNQALSERRAGAVRDYLISRGANGGDIDAIGRGESDPIADNATAEGRASNRRVDFEAI